MDNYDVKKRGAVLPDYTEAEIRYRNRLLNNLQTAYTQREQPQMELNDMGYSQYYLINRQSDMAYNPPKNNPMDSRIVTGIVHEKDNTIESLIISMNLQPKVKFYDENDPMIEDMAVLLTAKLKKSLIQENFDQKLCEYVRVLISQGNVFVLEQKKKNYETVKTVNANKKIVKMVKETGEACQSTLIPNTSVFFPNLLEADLHKQPYVYVVMHMPRGSVEQQFKDFKNWKAVPKFPTKTVPANTSGNWGDFYLQQPQSDYVEVIMYQSEIDNEYNILINGVMMYSVDEIDGECVGYPLTEFSKEGTYTIVKGDNERIPFYAYGKSVPMKNEVKEQVANELLRIMVHKMRYSSFPTLGNNSDKVLTSDIWAPATVIPDIQRKDIEVLFPEMQINNADFSFYQLIMSSIDETSVSKSVEGTNNEDITATQYVDQKRENLKKLGIVIDGAMDFLRQLYELRLVSIIEDLDKKKKQYSLKDQKEVETYESFISEEAIEGTNTEVRFNMVDEIDVTPEQLFKEEFDSQKPIKSMYVKPKEVKEIINKLKDKMYIEVVSEPEGQNQSLLGLLFNTLMAYQNLQGQPIPNLNYEYLDKLIADNSGFQSNKLFMKVPQQNVMMPQDPMAGLGGGMQQPGGMAMPSTPAKPPQNNILANATGGQAIT